MKFLNILIFFVLCFNIVKCGLFSRRTTTESPHMVKAKETKRHAYGTHTGIITFSKKNGVTVDYESIKILLHPDIANRKVVVYSIIGTFRKGKSFLMDYCLRFLYANYKSLNYPSNPLNKKADWIGLPEEPLTGFSWRGGTARNTEGIVMWSDIFLYDKPNGEKLAIILIDTQGLFDNLSSTSDSMKIFALNSLLSSFLIFNLQGVIQENQLEYLHLSTSYAKLISQLDTQSAAISSETKPFQDILFLLRDFENPFEFNFGLEGGKKYVDSVLHVKEEEDYDNYDDENNEKRSESLKSVREYIYSTFDNIHGFLMPHPGEAITLLHFDGRWSMLSQTFKNQMMDLIEWMMRPENLNPKQIFGQELTSKDFYHYLKAYCDGFKSADVPEVQSIFEITVNQQLNSYVDEALSKYKKTMSQHEDPSVDNFAVIISSQHQKAEEEAIEFFMTRKKLGDASHEEKYKKQLKESIQKTFDEWKEELLKIHQQISEYKQREKEAKERFEKERAEMNEALDHVVQENQKALEKMKKDRAEMDQQMHRLEQERVQSEKKLLEEQATMRNNYDKQIEEFNRQNIEKEAEFQRSLDEIQEKNKGDVEALTKAIEEQKVARAIELANQAEANKKMQENFKKELERKEQERQTSLNEFNKKMAKIEKDRRDEAERNARLREQNERELEQTKKNFNSRIETLTTSFNNQQSNYESTITDLKKEQQKLLETNKLQWQSWSISQTGIPNDAVVAGIDKDGSNLYVIRRRHGCNMYPGKYSLTRQQSYVSHDNREITYDSKGDTFEILRGTMYSWRSTSSYGKLFVGGSDCFNNSFYICRAYIYGYLTPGRYRNNQCVVSYGDDMHSMSSYDLLYN